MGQKGPERLHLWHYSQKKQNEKPKIFFHCRREDLSNLSRVWTAL